MNRRFEYKDDTSEDLIGVEEDLTIYIDDNGRRILRKRRFRSYMDGDWDFLDSPDDL